MFMTAPAPHTHDAAPAFSPGCGRGIVQVRADIARLAAAHARDADSIRLIAVSKQQPAEKVVAAARAGQRDFGENYLQEGAAKMESAARMLQGENISLRRHFIGALQSRKCREIAARFDWVHTVDNIKAARKLDQARAGLAPLKVLIQVNLQNDAAKSGVSESQLDALAEDVAALQNLQLRGLMLIPKFETDFTKQRAVFRRCRELRDRLNARGFALQHLSMGMSADMEAAIAEGASMLRLGTAVFGARAGKVGA